MPLSMPLELSKYIQDFARPVTHPRWREGSFSGEAVRFSDLLEEFECDCKSILCVSVPWSINGIKPSYDEVTWAQWYFVRNCLTNANIDICIYYLVVYGYEINYIIQENVEY